MDWTQYIGKFVSVLITGKGGKEENYLGTVKAISDDYMILDTTIPNDILDEVTFKIGLINSIWIYKKSPTKKKKTALRDKYGLGYPYQNK